MMNLQGKEEQRKQNAALFINTTQELIETEGLDQVSIRKIADKAGFHNSTIYLYFKDLDELLMLASIKYFQQYSQSLEELSQHHHSVLQDFISIWDLFYETIFQKPKIFYQFFFGKRSDNLKQILNTYYELFPEELHQFTSEIESMYFGNNLNERSLRILAPLIQEDTAVTADNVDMINDIIVSCTKCKLELKCRDDRVDSAQLIRELKTIILHVCGLTE